MNDNLVEQLRALDELHRAGSLSDAEFQAAKTQLLGQVRGGAVEMTPPNSSSELLFLQGELARIDREWELERERYKVAGRYVPTRGQGIGGGIAIMVFGLFWTAMASFITAGASSMGVSGLIRVFPLFGVLFIVVGLAKCAGIYLQADGHDSAEREYQNRRAQVLAKMRALETR